MASILGIDTIQNTVGTTAATIDASGRILTPARPAFRAEKRASHQSVTDSVKTKVVFEHEAFDIGSNYDASNSKFVAPIAGIYHFNILLRAVANTNTMDFVQGFLYKNGSLYSDIIQMQTTANYMQNSHLGGGLTVQLAASDEIEIYGAISGTAPVFQKHDDGQRTWFSGFLIG
tara:strand:+ start:4327 stop:4848 length:522 start_codon:yes stop_codon:yes gene_type:complete